MDKPLLILTKRVKKDYKKFPPHIQKKFKKQLRFLAADPRHPPLKIHRIKGTDYWEFYVNLAYRCVFRQEGQTCYLLAAGLHNVIDEFSRK